jgi:hypothetical protein
MARIRTIKPEFWQNEQLAALSQHARLLAIALLNHADDEGYFLANVSLVRSACFPFEDDSTNVRRSIDELSSIGYIAVKTCSGKCVGRIIRFADHQRIDRPQKSKLSPIYAEITDERPFDEDSTNDRRTIDELSLLEQGKEQGKERNRYTESDKPTSGSVSVFVPEPKTPKAKAVTDLPPPDGVDSQHWSDWIIARRRKKSGPITKTVIEILQREAKLSGLSVGQAVAMCAGKGWINFDHSWVNGGKKIEQANQITPIPFGKRTDIA